MPFLRPGPLACAAVFAASSWLVGCDARDVSVDETRVKVLSERLGRGRKAETGDVVCIDYRVLTPAEKEVLSAKDFCFQLGEGAVIDGVDETVPGMAVGGKRTIRCPPHKHWGRNGYGNGAIPKDTMLTIHISLTSLE
jgi:peptidylprolyl isomerase